MIINMTSGGVMPDRILDEQTITPGTKNVVFEEGTYLRGALTILGDANLIPKNIKEDQTIFNVSGTPGGKGVNVWNQYAGYIPPKDASIGFSRLSDNTMQVSVNGGDLSKINASMFTGHKFAQFYTGSDWRYYYFTGPSAWKVTDASGNTMYTSSYTFNQSTGVITLNATSTYSLYSYNMSFLSLAVTLPEEYYDLCKFVVSDDPSEYPEGGLHTDGFYYELLASVLSANVMRLSNNALDTVQQDYRDQIETEVSNA